MTMRESRLLDAVGIALGIAWAWWTNWNTGALVWGLWLSSLVVGFLSLLIGIAATGRNTRTLLRNGMPDTSPGAAAALARWATPIAVFYGVFLVAFFCIHFGGFHWGHSVFLNMYFPIDGSDPLTRSPMPRKDEYLQVLREGWGIVVLALIAERHSLFTPATVEEGHPQDNRMAAPYHNVVRLHLLIFFFAFAQFFGLKGMWLYLVVYAALFYPWQRHFPSKRKASA